MLDTGAVPDIDRAAWLRTVPATLATCAAQWSLTLGPAYAGGQVGYVVPATGSDGQRWVLKLQWPHRECRFEADALRLWDGDGAVRLIAHDAARGALLLERAVPGRPLSTLTPAAALDVAVALLPRLGRPAGEPFHTVERECEELRDELGRERSAGRHPLPRRLFDRAVELLTDLPATQRDERVLLSQDFHALNVLSDTARSWRAIDPAPLVGEREVGAVALVRGKELGHSRADVHWRLDWLSTELGLDRERLRLWTIAHTIAWSSDGAGGVLASHLDVVDWLS